MRKQKMSLGWILIAIIIYLHFHIFAWCLNEGCWDGIGQYVSDMMESVPISCGWMLTMLLINGGIFGMGSIVSLLIGIVPYYLILKWLVSIGSFQPHVD